MRIGYNNATELGPRQVEPYMKLKQSFLIACLVLPGTVWAAEAAHTATADQAAVVYGNNAFAVDLYGRLRMQDGNLFFSPESISTALAMTYAGQVAAPPPKWREHCTSLYPRTGCIRRWVRY